MSTYVHSACAGGDPGGLFSCSCCYCFCLRLSLSHVAKNSHIPPSGGPVIKYFLKVSSLGIVSDFPAFNSCHDHSEDLFLEVEGRAGGIQVTSSPQEAEVLCRRFRKVSGDGDTMGYPVLGPREMPLPPSPGRKSVFSHCWISPSATSQGRVHSSSQNSILLASD